MALFIVPNFKKFWQRIQNYDAAPIFGAKWSIYPKQIFIFEIITIIFIYLLAPFIVQNFKTEIWQKKILYKRENVKPEIKLMIENLQKELYQLENKRAKGAKIRANIRSWRAKTDPKLSLKCLKYEKSNNIWLIYWW